MPWGLGGKGPLYYLWDRPAGAVKRLMEVPCEIPQSVYIEAAVPSIIDGFLSYMSPDPRELYTRTFGHSVFCAASGSFGKVTHVPSDRRSRYQRFVLPLGRYADLSTYWYFLAGIVADGVYEWATLARKMSPCNPANGPFSASGQAWVGGIPDNGDYRTVDFWTGEGAFNGPVAATTMTVHKGDTCVMASKARFLNFLGQDVPCASQLVATVIDPGESLLPPGYKFLIDHHSVEQDIYAETPDLVTFGVWKPRKVVLSRFELLFSYTGGIPLPLREAFLAPSSTCFFAHYSHR